jgi:aerobic carbon-monoxide dehydrogenase medium subunit
MKAVAFEYHAPLSRSEALALLAEQPNAKVLAGGQSLMPMMNFRIAQPSHLIDINGVAELAGVRAAGGEVTIGAMTRQRELLHSVQLREAVPLMVEALEHVGHLQTRNRGTIGGSLCHADPAAELPTVCAALDASLTVESRDGTREIAMADWALGYLVTSLEPHEMLTGIRLRAWPHGHGWAFTEFARRHGDFAIVSVAVLLAPGANGRIARASIALGGCGDAPVRLRAAEALLEGQDGREDLFRQVAGHAADLEAGSDAYVSAEYRQHLSQVLVRRALLTAYARMAQGDTA